MGDAPVCISQLRNVHYCSSMPENEIQEFAEKSSSRVEVLKEEDGHSSSGLSEEEGGVLSHGEGSDREENRSPAATTSGPDSEFVPPTEELKNKIIAQVEFYFSDVNILKDAFLLKHVRRNKQGYVSLKLITSFRKIKTLTKDYLTVAYSLKESKELEVNEECTKVRRRNPLPEYDETTPSRSVLAVNLPFENPTIENLAEMFKAHGEIALVRIIRPGKPTPPDIKKYLTKHPEIDNAICAVIEFEQHDAARKAAAKMNNNDDWRKGLHVHLLAQPRNKDKQARKEETLEQQAGSQDESGPGKDGKKKKNKKKKGPRVEELAQQKTGGEGESPSSDGSEAENTAEKGDGFNLAAGEPIERRKSSGAGIPPNVLSRASLSPNPEVSRLSPSTTPRSSPRNTPRSSPRSSPRGSPNLRRKAHGKSPLVASSDHNPSPGGSPESQHRNSFGAAAARKGSVEMGTSPGGSPWVQRRLKAQQEQGGVGAVGRSPGTSPRLGRRGLDSDGIIRQPRGPDGPGFYGGLGRGKPSALAAQP